MADDKLEEWKVKTEHNLRVWEAAVNTNITVGAAHLAAVVGFANLAINSIILCNSAAAGAALAFIASIWDKANFKPAVLTASDTVLVFAIGATCGMLSAGISYLAQSLLQGGDLAEEGSKEEKRFYFWGGILRWIGFALAAIGLASFPLGAWQGLQALGLAVASTPVP